MSTGNNLENIYVNSIEILKDLIAFKTVSGEDNNQLIDYCDKILSSLGAISFRTYDEEKRVNLFSTLKAKKDSNKNQLFYLDIQMLFQFLRVGVQTLLMQQSKRINYLEEDHVI